MDLATCIIPARGGSKGIPRKNVQLLHGKPLIAWSIEQAMDSRLVGHVVVSTDDDEIANIAWKMDAEVFVRSAETATDTATSESALLEVLETTDKYTTRSTVFLQATSPIRQPGDIDNCVEMTQFADTVFSGRVIEGYTWTQGGGRLVANYTIREPRQYWTDSHIEENGSIYVFDTARFLNEARRIFGRTYAYTMHPLDSYQVDEPEDLEMMETLMAVRLDACQRTSTR
jgi:N-acylneuraminate cytidylyltransferase